MSSKHKAQKNQIVIHWLTWLWCQRQSINLNQTGHWVTQLHGHSNDFVDSLSLRVPGEHQLVFFATLINWYRLKIRCCLFSVQFWDRICEKKLILIKKTPLSFKIQFAVEKVCKMQKKHCLADIVRHEKQPETHEEEIQECLRRINLTKLDLDDDIYDRSTITKYFKGKRVFLTGGAGFLGQLYIEKLLR